MLGKPSRDFDMTISPRSILLAIILAAWHVTTVQAETPKGLDQAVSGFISANPYQAQSLDSRTEALADILQGDPESVFLPGSRLPPPTRALLKLEAQEGTGSAVRYRIRYGLGQDSGIAGLLRNDRLMDHETRTQWVRLRAVATGPGKAPAAELAHAYIPWPRFGD